MLICVDVCPYVYMRAYTSLHKYICIYINIHVRMYTNIDVYVHIWA